jgi:nitroimidazol reductase NimA-like FMN-containing flavoprotein (pyridoxamine 5'-phosphate oxidase superfamily)
MAKTDPLVELDRPYSDPAAKPTSWSKARNKLDSAGVYWLSTVRPDGRPHVTPIAAVLIDDAVYFSTGPEEQKSKNLAHNRQVVVTTGSNTFSRGLDVVAEGEAKRVTDEPLLTRLADAFEKKYEGVFGFRVSDGRFAHEVGPADVYEVAPAKAFAYQRGKTGAATRFRF